MADKRAEQLIPSALAGRSGISPRRSAGGAGGAGGHPGGVRRQAERQREPLRTLRRRRRRLWLTPRLHIYPDPLQRRLRSALSDYTGFGTENIIAGAGSDELIDLLFRLFIEPGDAILDCDPTFAMYAFCARVAGGEVKLVQRDELFEIDMQAVRESIDERTKIIFISSPNNPTGNLATEEQTRALLDTGLIVVIDEAYYEFSGETVAGLISEYDNLVVLRTMSKWAGLAGLRIGYGIMDEGLVNHIVDIKSPYNVNIGRRSRRNRVS